MKFVDTAKRLKEVGKGTCTEHPYDAFHLAYDGVINNEQFVQKLSNKL